MKTTHALVRFPFVKDPLSQPTLSRELARVFIRTLFNRLNAAQTNWALPSSTAAYKLWMSLKAKKEGIPTEVVTEVIGDDGAKLHWIGRKDAKKVLLHFHSESDIRSNHGANFERHNLKGGGFVLPLHLGHFSLINYFRREVTRRSGVEVKAAFLEYSSSPQLIGVENPILILLVIALSSRAKYPTQYRQAMRVVQHVVNSGISPADIVITGDSAGGMLAMQVISIFLHPNSSITSMPMPSVPFAGILLISPWAAMDSNAPSFVNNGGDCVSDISLGYFAKMAGRGIERTDTKGVPEEYWCEPLKAPTEWWRGTENITKHMLFIYGGHEALRDDIVSLVEKVREAVKGTKVDVATMQDPTGVHIAPVLDAAVGRAPCDVTKFMANWVYDRIVT